MRMEGLGETNASILQIKELKEKVLNLVSDVELNRENAKFQLDEDLDGNYYSSGPSDGDEEEFLDLSELEFLDETNWLTEENRNGDAVEDICQAVYATVDDDRPDVTALCRQLQLSSIREPNIFRSLKPSIDSRTFTRPKKSAARPSLDSVIDSGDKSPPKLERRNTTTITPTPNIIRQLVELGKTNNRPVSGNYSNVNFEDGAAESFAEMPTNERSKPETLETVRNKLKVLKKSNTPEKSPKMLEPSLPNGKVSEFRRSAIFEEAKKVKAALDIDLKGPTSSRFSEIFRNTQECNSDDNESFFSLDEVSGFCGRLTLSTNQSAYASVMREMQEQDICLFHRNDDDFEDQSMDKRLTFGGVEIPLKVSPKRNMDQTHVIGEEGELNRTYEIEEEQEKANSTYEIRNAGKHNIMNRTYDADSKHGLVDVIMQSNVMKNLSPKNLRENNINNNNRLTNPCEANNVLSSTYDKMNGTLYQNELNAKRTERYSTKVFDSSFRKVEKARSPTRRINGKKDSDYSEDDCMSNTSDNSCRSFDSNTEVKSTEDVRSVGLPRSKRYFSTPNAHEKGDLHFGVMSPIRMEMGDGESRAYSNPSSRGESPRRIPAPDNQEGLQKHRMPNIRQPLKVPQRELKLIPALVRPSQKRPLSSTRTSSEPSVPQKVENCQSTASVPLLRPSGPTAVPSLTNVRPSSRTSGIPRPPTRLKQPQIRVNYSKK